MLGFGFSVLATALTWLTFEMSPTTPIWRLVLPFFAMGVGMAFVWSPLTATATRNLPPHLAGAGSAVYNSVRQLGAVLGSAGMAAFMTWRITDEMPRQPSGGATGEEALTLQLPGFLREPFAAAMSQSVLLPAFIALFGIIAALFLVGVAPRAAKGDGMHGWRLQGTRVLQPRSPQRIKMAQGYHRVQPGFEIGMPVRALSAEAGNRFRVHLMRDGFIDFKAFSQTEYYQQYYRNLGIADRLWICFPLNREIESIIVFDRHEPHGHFTRKQAAWAATVWHGLRWFHRQLVLSHGILGAQSSLSPGQRRLVQELLTGKTEKEIAATLGQSAATTHQYVKAILRHFGVNSRASLMALWLGAR